MTSPKPRRPVPAKTATPTDAPYAGIAAEAAAHPGTPTRWLVALDALLAHRSVTRAAEALDMQTSGMSRLLSAMRLHYGDALFERTGRQMVPTPFAAALQPALRRLIEAQADMLALRPSDLQPGHGGAAALAPEPALPAGAHFAPHDGNLPMSRASTAPIEGAPSLSKLRRLRNAPSQAGSSPQEELARIISIIGLGGGQSRALMLEEAEAAMAIILAGEADPIQIGAFLQVLQYRGLNADELAGLARAAQAAVRARHSWPDADLDWPCHVSPKVPSAPWFYHAARLVAQAGHRVVMHGITCAGQSGTSPGRHDQLAADLGITVADDPVTAERALARGRPVFLPLPALSPQLERLTRLYGLTRLRSPAFSLMPLLCPAPARASILGGIRSSALRLHQQAAQALGWRELVVISSMRDVAQFTPFRTTVLHRLTGGQPCDTVVAPRPEPMTPAMPRSLAEDYSLSVWRGAIRDPRAEEIILGTAASALLALGGDTMRDFDSALAEARALWRARPLDPNAGESACPPGAEAAAE